MLLARDDSSGYNLAIGDPSALFWYHVWDQEELKNGLSFMEAKYPSINGMNNLVQSLKDLNQGYEHVVIGNGAKQCLMAAMWAFQETEGLFGVVPHTPINWPSFPTITEITGGVWDPNKEAPRLGSLDLIAYPGNPFSQRPAEDRLFHIWDAVYASETYGWDGWAPKHIVKISSVSKLLGLPGLRVGWILTNDAKIAHKAKQYIEFTTSGVSGPGQRMAKIALWYYASKAPYFQKGLKDVRLDLEANRLSVQELLEPHLNICRMGDGMFAYIQFKDPDKAQKALKAANVKFVPGLACGDPTPGTYRVSLGVDIHTMRNTLTFLKMELNA